MIRTKIVATMGPACGSVEMLLRLFQAGVSVCRLNFSHGSLDDHATMLRHIREAAEKIKRPIAVLGDLCGPKIRLGQIKDHAGTGGMPINVGDQLIIQRGEILGEKGRVSCTYPKLIDEVDVGHRLLVEDGMQRFLCTDKSTDELICTCVVGGVLKSKKGINLPNTQVTVPSITDRDWECVDWAIANNLDYLALSFVRRADDLLELRNYLADKISDIHLIAKIEKNEALSKVDSIIDASDGLMVARGDLGVEMDVAQVPLIQKDLIRRCTSAGKLVIVATQMLQSMIESSTPTRAEVSDIANAIFDGTDAIMLSGETSVGKHPVETVHVMSHIADVTEEYLSKHSEDISPLVKTSMSSGAMARGAWRIVQDMNARAVVIWTQTGQTARVFSKHRFHVPIIAMSNDPRILRKMSLHYGVVPHDMVATNDLSSLIERVDQMMLSEQMARKGEQIMIVAGWSPGTPGMMNGMLVHTLGEQWTPVPNPAILRKLMRAERE